MLDRAQLKQEAKGILHSARVSPYVFTLIFMVVLLVLNGISSYTSGSYLKTLQENFPDVELPAYLLRLPSLSPAVATFIGILITLVSNVLNAGNAIYHLGIRRGREMPCSTLLNGFRVAGRVILLDILKAIFIILWSLLFIIPGMIVLSWILPTREGDALIALSSALFSIPAVIAAYRYRFSLYNLLENPELSPLDAISMSKMQTKGHKWDLFVLDLSFLGWILLCGLTLGILSIWISPYITQTDVGYFRAIKAEKGIGVFPDEDNAPSGF